jgi:hypothetical protein
MEKIKLLPMKDRPQDYLIWTCPICSKKRENKTIRTGQVYKTIWDCHMSLRGGSGPFCEGMDTYKINPKYI